jgi:CheY-like chemotaxis protein
MALVLCTGVDPAVVRTRQLILERAGHVVVPALDEASLIQACQQNRFDVAVVGQTVSPKIKRRIAELIRETCTDTKLLELYTISTGRVLDDADSWLEVLADVPQELAARVAGLTAR